MEKKNYFAPAVKAYKITPSAIICGSVDETPVDNSHIHRVRSEESDYDIWSVGENSFQW